MIVSNSCCLHWLSFSRDNFVCKILKLASFRIVEEDVVDEDVVDGSTFSKEVLLNCSLSDANDLELKFRVETKRLSLILLFRGNRCNVTGKLTIDESILG